MLLCTDRALPASDAAGEILSKRADGNFQLAVMKLSRPDTRLGAGATGIVEEETGELPRPDADDCRRGSGLDDDEEEEVGEGDAGSTTGGGGGGGGGHWIRIVLVIEPAEPHDPNAINGAPSSLSAMPSVVVVGAARGKYCAVVGDSARRASGDEDCC